MNDKLKREIITNEKNILSFYKGKQQENAIKQYIHKLEIIKKDADLYNFIIASFNSKTILEHEYNNIGFKSSRQLIEEHKSELNFSDITNIKNLDKDASYSYLDICAMSNNFNPQVGMYYLKNENCVVIKTTVEDNNRPYDDRWYNREKNILIYCIQSEKDENVKALSFIHKPNYVIFNSLMSGELIDIHVFMNRKKGESYNYEGIFHPCGLVDGNNAFMLFREGHDNEIPFDNFDGELWKKLIKSGEVANIQFPLFEEHDIKDECKYYGKKIIHSKRNMLQQNKLDLEIYLRGDALVLQYEYEKLASEGRNDLVEKVKNVSIENSDLGYDILSFEKDLSGKYVNKHLIVKTTVNKNHLSFDITDKEKEEMMNPYSYIYRVYDIFSDRPKFVNVTDLKMKESANSYHIELL